MHTLTEVRRDVSSHQVGTYTPNTLNNNSVNISAQNRGGGDGLTAGLPENSAYSNRVSGPVMIPYSSQPAQPHNNMPHINCRNAINTNAYTQNERNDIGRSFWRQSTPPCLQQRPQPNNAVVHQPPPQLVPPLPPPALMQQYSVVNQFGPLRLDQVYTNDNAAYNNRQMQQLLSTTINLDQNGRNYMPMDTTQHIGHQQSSTVNQPVFMNYTNNISNYQSNTAIASNPSPQILNCLSAMPQFSYYPQNMNQNQQIRSMPQPPIVNSTSSRAYQLPPISTPQTASNSQQTPLVFGPPPRDKRTNLNNIEDTKNLYQDYDPPVSNNTLNQSPSIPIQSIFQSFSNQMKLPVLETDLNRLQYQNTNNNTFISDAESQHFISKTLSGENIQPKSDLLDPDKGSEHLQSDNNQIHTVRSNIKLKFSKNVVNIPKKIENSETESSKESLKTVFTEISEQSNNLSNGFGNANEDILNWQLKDANYISLPEFEDGGCSSPFVLHEESAFIDMIVEGCIRGEEIATKYQNVPCFKNIKKLCEKTKTDLMTPHCTARNIHSQGIPWATKDYIFAFTRLTSCWYLLKGYLGQKSDVFEKIEQLYSPDLRKSFELWEQTTASLAFNIMKSFIALGNNSSTKWNPSAHSTPFGKDKKKINPNTMPITMANGEKYNSKKEVQILSRNSQLSDIPSPKILPDIKNSTENKYFYPNQTSNQIFKPILSQRYDLDSDEETAKKYIKPGCYTVPQIYSKSTQHTTLDQSASGYKKSKIPPITILSHRSEIDSNQSIDSSIYNDNSANYLPFKKTPQGIITSALMKKTREECLKSENQTVINDSNSSKFDKETNKLNFRKTNSTDLLQALENVSKSESVRTNDLKTEKESNEIEEQSRGEKEKLTQNESTDYKLKFANYTKKQYRNNNETKYTSIRKGFIVTKRRSEISGNGSECPNRATIKKAHKSYYNTILSGPKYLIENNNYNNTKVCNYHKCRQNVKWGIWYSRKRDGLSRLAIQTFERILNELWNMPNSHYFVFEVDVRDVPDYYEVIKHPMFLTNILQKLKQYKYTTLNQVVHDFRRMFRNARLFLELHPDKKLQRLISHFSNTFEQLLGNNFPRIDFSNITGDPNEIQLLSTNLSDQSSECSPVSGTNNNYRKQSSSGSSTPSKSDQIMSASSQEDR